MAYSIVLFRILDSPLRILIERSYSDISPTTLSGNIPLDRLQQQVDIAEAATEEPVGLDFRKANDILAVDRWLGFMRLF